MSRRPQGIPRPGFLKVCLCPAGDRDLRKKCKDCHGWPAIERCPDCEDRGELGAVGQTTRHGKLWRNRGILTPSKESPESAFFAARGCETCGGRRYVRTDRKVDAYAVKAKPKREEQ